MAMETTDYAAALEFIRQTKRRACYLPTPAAPEGLHDTIPYLGLGLTADYDTKKETLPETERIQVFASGWTELEGVMLLKPETEFDADVRVALAARNERALRDLLLAFPPGKLGFFYLGGDW